MVLVQQRLVDEVLGRKPIVWAVTAHTHYSLWHPAQLLLGSFQPDVAMGCQPDTQLAAGLTKGPDCQVRIKHT